jgi:predicted hydrocarbon binding protein
VISRDKEKGWVIEDTKRLVTFRIKTFQSLIDRLTSLVGSRVSETILSQLGNEIGHVTFDYSREVIKSEADLGPVLDNVLADRGRGRCTDFEKQARDGKTIYTVRTRGSPLSHERTSATATCRLVGGIVSGYLEAYLGKKAQSYVERECESRGNQFCVFETAFTP